MTAAHGPGQRWRSRAFVQPLLVTLLGVVASTALFLAAADRAGGPPGQAMAGLGIVVLLFPVYLGGLVATGFTAQRSSRDSGLAGRAIVVAMVLLAVVLLVAVVFVLVTQSTTWPVEDPFSASYNLVLGLAFGAGLLLLPIWLGFALGQRGQRTEEKPRI